MASVYVSLGSNIEREANICSCMQQLKRDFGNVVFSPVYETPAEGFTGEPFLNLVAGFSTELTPTALKQYFRQVETAHGRVHGEKKFSARTLDLDLLLYDTLNLQPEHNLPHHDIVAYPFVLFPLADIAPDAMHPGLQRTVAEISADTHLSRDTLSVVELDCSTFKP
jgi:2-amino-4-hydroxy-6-hydroxymethyldihydropteridine diphosphokinase